MRARRAPEPIARGEEAEPRRKGSGAAVAMLVFALLQEVSPGLVFWASLAYVVLSTLDRIASRWAMAAHKNLIRKLVQHLADSGRKS